MINEDEGRFDGLSRGNIVLPDDGLFQQHWPNGNLRYEWYYDKNKSSGRERPKRGNIPRRDGISKGWYESVMLKQTPN